MHIKYHMDDSGALDTNFDKVVDVYTMSEPTVYLCRVLLSDDLAQIIFRFAEDSEIQREFYRDNIEHIQQLIVILKESNSVMEALDKLRENFDIDIKDGTIRNALDVDISTLAKDDTINTVTIDVKDHDIEYDRENFELSQQLLDEIDPQYTFDPKEYLIEDIQEKYVRKGPRTDIKTPLVPVKITTRDGRQITYYMRADKEKKLRELVKQGLLPEDKYQFYTDVLTDRYYIDSPVKGYTKNEKIPTPVASSGLFAVIESYRERFNKTNVSMSDVQHKSDEYKHVFIQNTQIGDREYVTVTTLGKQERPSKTTKDSFNRTFTIRYQELDKAKKVIDQYTVYGYYTNTRGRYNSVILSRIDSNRQLTQNELMSLTLAHLQTHDRIVLSSNIVDDKVSLVDAIMMGYEFARDRISVFNDFIRENFEQLRRFGITANDLEGMQKFSDLVLKIVKLNGLKGIDKFAKSGLIEKYASKLGSKDLQFRTSNLQGRRTVNENILHTMTLLLSPDNDIHLYRKVK